MDFIKASRNDGLTSKSAKIFGRSELKPHCSYPIKKLLSKELSISQKQAVIKQMEKKTET